ncbi:Ig-like domain-containing protein [Chryseobacterium koreense]|uniref:Ig-like domain-containing domain n=1 Tax=Chryseobacterium koreense TaxID=232216 RepID=UPI0026EEE871|nr:Ig-like domain-containing protein [Chryseobacterium koreense]
MKRILLLFIFSWLLFSCARVGSPVGGNKDTIPPRVVGSNIDSARISVPIDIRELRIDFDEYITLKEINKNLIISPPIKIKKILPSGVANKYLVIKWDEMLQANTTYNFNFGNAIVDNNEGNALKYYNFAFSTGEKIDDLYISGEVKTLIPNKDAKADEKSLVVGLYQVKDTMNYRQKPYYITKADPDGYFELNYLSPGKYRILAFEDANSNSVFDAGKESVGFLKEELDLNQSISGLKIDLFPSKKKVRYTEMKEVPGGILMLFEGNPDEVKVTAKGNRPENFQVTHVPKSDSLYIWFDAKKENLGITQSENLKFAYDNGVKKDSASMFYRFNAKNEMTLSNAKGNLLPPSHDFVFTSNYYVDNIQPEKWKLVLDSIQQEFTAKISEKNPFEIRLSSNFKEGKKYSLTVPKETVSSFFESNAKSYRFDFQSDKTENYGTFFVTLENAPTHHFWLQMLNETGDVAYSKFGKETKQTFNAVKPGKYQLRILVDNNENGSWDTADFENNEFAEEVYVFEKKIDIRPLWEIREIWNLNPKKDGPETTPQLPAIPTDTVPKNIKSK